jgi:hypothetical protein
LPGQAPFAPDRRDICVCDDKHYNASIGLVNDRPIACVDVGGSYLESIPTASGVCMPCKKLDICVTCSLGTVVVKPDHTISQTLLHSVSTFSNISVRRSVFACPIKNACTGDVANPCHAAYAGPLCSNCNFPKYSRAGLVGQCTECSGIMSVVWIIFGGILALVGTVSIMWFVSESAGAISKLTKVVTFFKIGVSSLQVRISFNIHYMYALGTPSIVLCRDMILNRSCKLTKAHKHNLHTGPRAT